MKLIGLLNMVDIRFIDLVEGTNIVFILNNRGEKPRLLHGVVKGSTSNSLLVEDDIGELHNLSHSARSHRDGRFLRAAVIPQVSNCTEGVVDCIGHTIAVGDYVAFMEVPSQGFCSSLLVGDVIRIEDDGLTIKVYSSTTRKYFRKPDEVAVVEQISENIISHH